MSSPNRLDSAGSLLKREDVGVNTHQLWYALEELVNNMLHVAKKLG